LHDGDVVLGWLPLFHDMGLMGIALHPLYKGIPSILMTPDSFIRRPMSWLRAISEHGATTSGAPDFAYEMCVRLARQRDKEGLDLSRWRVAFSGSERVRPRTLARFEETFGDRGFQSRHFLPCYGMAEATLMISGRLPDERPVVRRFDARALIESQRAFEIDNAVNSIELTCVGRALRDETIAIVSQDSQQKLSDGELGEVWVHSASVSEGYWESQSDSRTFPSWDEARGYLRTGDVGFLQAGELFITGRLKDLIIIRGRNLHPEDVEIGVEPCLGPLLTGTVVAFPTEVADQERLVVVFETEPANEHAIADLAESVKRVIGERFEVELHALCAVKRGSIPRTSSGKRRRGETRSLWEEKRLSVLAQAVLADGDSPGAWRAERETLSRLPADEARALVNRDIIKWIRQASGAGTHEGDPTHEAGRAHEADKPHEALSKRSLLSLGLGSLQVIRLIHEIEDHYDVSIALADAFRVVSVEALAGLIVDGIQGGATLPNRGARDADLGGATGLPATTGLARDGDLAGESQLTPLSLGQQGIWFAQQVFPTSSAWQVARAAEVSPAINIDALNSALEQVVRRHAALRTAISAEHGSVPTQRVLDAVSLRAKLVSCESRAEHTELLRAEAESLIDLACPPLLRVSVLRTPGSNDVLVLVAHHIICDLWSLSLLLRDLFEFYRGVQIELVATHVPGAPCYLDHVRNEQRLASSELWRQRTQYWKGYLGAPDTVHRETALPAGERSIGELPTGQLPRGERLRGDRRRKAATHMRTVDRELSQALRRAAQQQGVSLHMLLFAAFQLAVAAFEGQTEFLMCSLTSGREHRSRREVIGYFANLLPFRVQIDWCESVGPWLSRVRRELLDAYANELPYEEIVRACGRREAHEAPGRYAFIMQDEGATDSAGFVPLSLGQAGGRWTLAGVELCSLPFEEGDAQFPLALYAGVHDGVVRCCYKGTEATVGTEDIARVADLVDRALRWLSAGQGDRILGELEWLNAAERSALVEAAATASTPAYLRPQSLLDAFEAQCRETPDRIALEFEDTSVSYAGLHRMVVNTASELQSRGVGSETIVGVCTLRSVEMVVSIYGVLKAGGAYLPLEPSYPAEYLKTLVAESG
ncbi:MAG TPA: condensation domain-containing protein, partial [Steroidobacteraceae bacterium]|nr:condensation domain-containing protein [Steroidobacteraceae bacterium]